MVVLGNTTSVLPSVAFLREDGQILIGEAAERRAGTHPERVAREFKRRFGDPAPMILGGTPYSADSLLAISRMNRRYVVVDQAWAAHVIEAPVGERARRRHRAHPAGFLSVFKKFVAFPVALG